MILVLLCFPTTMGQITVHQATAADQNLQGLINCDIQRGPCTKDLAGCTVSFDIHPKPVRAMKDLKFRVSVSGTKQAMPAYLDLGMPGMDMGPNRVKLRPVKDNVCEGQGVLVRCPSGSRTWRATVNLPEVGKVEFIFDVVN